MSQPYPDFDPCHLFVDAIAQKTIELNNLLANLDTLLSDIDTLSMQLDQCRAEHDEQMEGRMVASPDAVSRREILRASIRGYLGQ